MKIVLFRYMIAMDLKSLEWRYCLYTLYFFKRQHSASPYIPTDDEKNAIIQAIKISTDTFHPRIHLGYITCLADTIKNRSNFRTTFQFGDKIFSNADAALNHIREDGE